MAWRPYENLIEGSLDNRVKGRVTGWIDFYQGRQECLHVTLELEGDFHADIAGYLVQIVNREAAHERVSSQRESYMAGFLREQRGVVGDMTAGWPVRGQVPYTAYPYLEWFAQNGRVVLEDPQVTVIGGELRQVSEEEVAEHRRKTKAAMRRYMEDLVEAMRRLRREK
jgi:hypothetical protein